MTARPTDPLHDALSAEERELATRVARLDASAGPSSALDARILAAARAAAVPAANPSTRRVRRWPGAVGAAAVLVAAVGLAWQLRPMFQLPPPVIHSGHAGAGKAPGAEADTVVQVETVPRRTPPAAAPVIAPPEVTAQPPAAARKTAPAVGGGAPRVQNRAPTTATRASVHDLLDEAVPPPAAPPPPPPPPPAAMAAPEPRAFSAAPAAKATSDAAATAGVDEGVDVTGSRMRREAAVATPAPAAASAAPAPDVSADARLPTRDWLARIRARRDHGDIAGARASLARFVIAHPRVAVPTDLRPLLPPDDPWSP
ncbi:hypothetical protein DWG18_08335 [Lysobacter sp. TY2-98]|uniref:hypothetical protein n=1 Tax=Lysobacter sp. TY2-98 TaxID=2290922 RepID=UPI000E2092D9|nr:hypothetical protein [Lysobacter sp. TY2-98]AXK72287.1 hypothetical protein DWG18_08335 [Lysobacter sp. TY2-98]